MFGIKKSHRGRHSRQSDERFCITFDGERFITGRVTAFKYSILISKLIDGTVTLMT